MKDVVTHLINPKRIYNPNVRRFALVLSLKSKSAYRWFRKKCSNRLPTKRTLTAWNANICKNSFMRPGFNFQSKSLIQKLAQKAKAGEKELYVRLCFDEVSIRRHIQWMHNVKRFNG